MKQGMSMEKGSEHLMMQRTAVIAGIFIVIAAQLVDSVTKAGYQASVKE